jgi:hypothetical protein
MYILSVASKMLDVFNKIINSISGKVIGLLRWVNRILVIEPLWQLYLDAPAVGGVGGWEGRELPDICAQMTGISASHWQNGGYVECVNHVERKFYAHKSVTVNLFRIFVVFSLCLEVYYTILYKLRKCTRPAIGEACYIIQNKNSD